MVELCKGCQNDEPDVYGRAVGSGVPRVICILCFPKSDMRNVRYRDVDPTKDETLPPEYRAELTRRRLGEEYTAMMKGRVKEV